MFVARLLHAALTIVGGYGGMRYAMWTEYGGFRTRHPWFIVLASVVSAAGTFAWVLQLRRSREPDPDVADLRSGRFLRLVCAVFAGVVTACAAISGADLDRHAGPARGAMWFVLFLGGPPSVLTGSLWLLGWSAKQRWFDHQGLSHRGPPRARVVSPPARLRG